MTQEEKAEAYDEAYKRVAVRFGSNVADEIFPELKESEDERIRKAIITYLKQRKDRSSSIPAAIDSWIAWLEKQGKQKPAWSEEDESKIRHLIAFLDTNPNSVIYSRPKEEWIAWLKFLKDRVQPKMEWSEEDEENIKVCIGSIKHSCYSYSTKQRAENFLKSLRPQLHWKPSVFHLECITDAIIMCEERSITSIGLKEILDELKKLREE